MVISSTTILLGAGVLLIVIVVWFLLAKKPQPKQQEAPPVPKPLSTNDDGGDDAKEESSVRDHKDESKRAEETSDKGGEASSPSELNDDEADLDDDEDASGGEITMMGRVPEEVLEAMKGSLKAPDESVLKEPEEEAEMSTDIDVESLMDESTPEDENTGTHALILVVGVARSDRGKKRKSNEDAFLVMEEEHLFVVADGMGGHNAGDVASQAAIEEMKRAFESKQFDGPAHEEWPRRGDELVRAIHMANNYVYEKSKERDEYEGMGTTIVSIRFSPNKQRAYIAHVGDSRCYRLRDGELHQLTEDHTLGNLIGAKGPMAKHLAQAVGVRPEVAVDLAIDQPNPGDYYLVCSDGLTKMVPNDVIRNMLLHPKGNLEQTASALIQEANDRGGRDNITVILVQIGTPKDLT